MNNLSGLILKFLQENGYYLDSEILYFQLLSHPDFPSFKSVSDTLDYFGIDNLAINVPPTALEQLPQTFLSLVIINGKEELVFVKKIKGRIKIQFQDLTKIVSIEEFKQAWSCNIIAVEKQAAPKLSTFSAPTAALAGMVAIVLIISIAQAVAGSLSSALYLLLSGTGLIAAYFLIRQDIGIKDTFMQKVCGSNNPKGGCKNVVNSGSSKILGIFSLLEASFTFFLAQIAVVLLLGFKNECLLVPAALSVPVISYSVYSQWVVIKNWCTLCLTISGVVLLQLLVVTVGFKPVYNMVSVIYFVKAAFIFVLLYLAVSAYLRNARKLAISTESVIKFKKFKRNVKIFTTLLKAGKPLDATLNKGVHAIAFGAANPVIDIIAVTNPLCGYCATSFNLYYKLLKKYPDTIRVSFVFLVPHNDFKHPSTNILSNILTTYLEKDKEQALQLLNEWYANRDVLAWQAKYKTADFLSMQVTHILQQHELWCYNIGVDYTPATFFNGYLYPTEYEAEDIDALMGELLISPAFNKNIGLEASMV